MRRDAVSTPVAEDHYSERRACLLVGLSRDAYRHAPQTSRESQNLTESIRTVALQRRRFGQRRVHDLLRQRHPHVNHKRVYRIYREADLAVRKHRKGRRPLNQLVPLVAATRVNQTWGMDFFSDSLCNGRRIKMLTVVDNVSHECVSIAVDFGIGGKYVTRLLDQAACSRGYPQAIRTDNGPKFVSRALLGWLQPHPIQHSLIQPRRPMQNGYIESFNGKLRDECLNEHWFDTLNQARQIVRVTVQDCNEVRPHSSIGRISPKRFAHLHHRRAGDAAINEATQ